MIPSMGWVVQSGGLKFSYIFLSCENFMHNLPSERISPHCDNFCITMYHSCDNAGAPNKESSYNRLKFDNDSDVFYSNQYLSFFFQNATIIIENAN